MIIHPSSAIPTAEPLRWETMSEEPAPGPHPRKKSAANKLESRVPGFESRGTKLRETHFFFFLFQMTAQSVFFMWEHREEETEVSEKGKKNGEFSLLKQQKKSIAETSKHLRQD